MNKHAATWHVGACQGIPRVDAQGYMQCRTCIDNLKVMKGLLDHLNRLPIAKLYCVQQLLPRAALLSRLLLAIC